MLENGTKSKEIYKKIIIDLKNKYISYFLLSYLLFG